jgi:hypothetical protein
LRIKQRAKSTTLPIATARAESRKRKGGDGPKAITKKRMSSKASKDSDVEEMAESAYDGSTTAQASAEASATRMDKDLTGSSFQTHGGGS